MTNKLPEIEKPLRSSKLADLVSEWDAKFVDVEQTILFELILAANYMDCKSLLDLTCAKVASMIKGKSPDQIREQFGIVNDFTPEEEKKVGDGGGGGWRSARARARVVLAPPLRRNLTPPQPHPHAR